MAQVKQCMRIRAIVLCARAVETNQKGTTMSTLNTLLTKLREADDGIIEMDIEQLQETLGSVRDKVDGIFEVISKLESEAERMKKLAKSFAVRQKSCENQVARLKNYITYSMDQDGATEIYGEIHQMKLVSRKTQKVRDLIIGPEMFIKFQEVVRRDYSFDKNLLKEKAKADPDRYADLMETSESRYLRFSVK